MLRTRLWMGTLLALLALGVLVFDQRLAPWYPFLFLLLWLTALAACLELVGLLDAARRPPRWLCAAAVSALLLSNWTAPLLEVDPWHCIGGVFVAVVLAAFLVEMASYREPGTAVTRMALTVWVAGYLGLLPCFLAQLRWPAEAPAAGEISRGTLALTLAIFVPKCCDIGAYFAGRLFGRHRMTPLLSPKKTWEGAAGGLALAALTAVAVNRLGPVLSTAWLAVLFGLSVGLAGMVGDLAESLIKRDSGQKDASQVVPGYGGVLDVIDSVLFAAPLAYCWLKEVGGPHGQ